MGGNQLEQLNVAVIGTGYVGLSTGVVLAYLGHKVTCVDKDHAKLDLLRAGRCPIYEPGIEQLLKSLTSSRQISFTDNVAEAVPESHVIIVAVGTPPTRSGEADTRYVELAAREVAEAFLPGRAYVLVVKSTVPVGSNRRVTHVVDQVLGSRGLSGRVTYYVASNPEFLREGRAVHDSLYPDRIVVGATRDEAVQLLESLYKPILEQTFTPPSIAERPAAYGRPPLVVTDPTSAEMIKYAANAFLATKISFINEIAGLCEQVGADVTEVARGIGLDHRISPWFLSAGLGWGGSCFPKDTAALIAVAKEHGYELPIIQAARLVNEQQRWRVVGKIQRALKGVRGRTIGVLGVSFKPLTDDVRESPVIGVVTLLLERGAHVRVHDPVALHNFRKALGESNLLEDQLREVTYIDNPYDVAIGSDALVLATEWPEYQELDLGALAQRMRHRILVDARNFFDPQVARNAGFYYEGVGR